MSTAAVALEPKSNHRVNVVRIKEVKVHPNADKLEIYPIDGTDYQYIGTKGQFQVGQLAAYIQPDSVVPEQEQYKFLWEGRVFEGSVPERYRRIKAKKLRKEWSEGLLIPISKSTITAGYDSFHQPVNVEINSILVNNEPVRVNEGDDVADLMGIYHYEPPEPLTLPGDCERGPRKIKYPHSVKGWFFFILRRLTFNYFNKYGVTDGGQEAGPGFPVYDVEAYKNYKGIFHNDELVVITEKIHGSNFRAVFYDNKFYVGSRKLWKKEKSGCVWRRVTEQHPWIEEWCRKNPGYAIYGEIVPTQGGYNYGTKSGETKLFVFDVLKPDNTWVSWEELQFDSKYSNVLAEWVPVLDERFFHEEIVKSLVDGPSKVSGANHNREGVVIRPMRERFEHHLGRVQLKIVSNEFLEKSK